MPAVGLALALGLSGCVSLHRAPEVVRVPAVRELPVFECPDWPVLDEAARERGFELEAERRERWVKGRDAHTLCQGAYLRLREQAESWVD